VKPPELIACRGLPGSGKTTWARQQLAAAPLGTLMRVNRDGLRCMMLPADYRRPVPEIEQQVSLTADLIVTGLLNSGISVIADDTNLHPEHLRRVLTVAQWPSATWRVADFVDVPLETCIARDAMRDEADRVGREVIVDMHKRHIAPFGGRLIPVPVPDGVTIATLPRLDEPVPRWLQ